MRMDLPVADAHPPALHHARCQLQHGHHNRLVRGPVRGLVRCDRHELLVVLPFVDAHHHAHLHAHRRAHCHHHAQHHHHIQQLPAS